MRGLRLFFQFIGLSFGVSALSCAFTLPIIAAVLFFSPRAALGVVMLLSIIPLALLLLLSEWAIMRLFGGQIPRTHGLRNSYEMAYAAAGVKLKARPALITFADPVPNIFVIRAIGGDGLILLSDGLISLLDESELRFVLTRAIQHIMTGEAVLQSACIFGIALLQRRRRVSGGASLALLSPTQAFSEFLLYPWFRFFSKLALGTVTRRVAGNQLGHPADSDFVRGASKLSRAGRLYGQQTVLPGLVYLGIER